MHRTEAPITVHRYTNRCCPKPLCIIYEQTPANTRITAGADILLSAAEMEEETATIFDDEFEGLRQGGGRDARWGCGHAQYIAN